MGLKAAFSFTLGQSRQQGPPTGDSLMSDATIFINWTPFEMQTRTSNLSEDSSCASKHSIQIGGKASISGGKGGGAGTSELLLHLKSGKVRVSKQLIHWGRVTYICVNKTIIGSDNGLPPGRCEAIIWTNAGILLIWTLGTNFSEILNKIHTFLFNKMHLKMPSVKWHQFCLRLNAVNAYNFLRHDHVSLWESFIIDVNDQWFYPY